MVSYIHRCVTIAGSLILAASASAGGGAPSNTEHQVGIGDSIESIAKKYAGHEKYVDSIHKLNPHLEEVGLQVGDYLFVPDEPVAKNEPVALPDQERLPPSPLHSEKETKIIPGVKYGLAHVYRPSGFKVVAAPVDKE